jgi:arylsulfatase
MGLCEGLDDCLANRHSYGSASDKPCAHGLSDPISHLAIIVRGGQNRRIPRGSPSILIRLIEKGLSFFIFVLGFLGSFPNAPAQSQGASQPNMVILMADDMGWSDAGCYGGEIQTPNIDRLANEGLRFTQFYNNSICGPTRASLLTGLYCQQVGHRGDRWNEPKDFSRCATFAEILQDAGYHTMMVGKWQGRDLAVKRGFGRFFGPNCQALISYYNEVQNNDFYLNGERWKFPESGFFMTDAFADYSVRFLEEAGKQDRPFLLYTAFIAPHWPLHAREKDIAPYRRVYAENGWNKLRDERFERHRKRGLVPPSWSLSKAPEDIPNWEKEPYKDWQAERMAVYAAQIACMDLAVGRILEALDRAGVAENTLVLFLSDNGATHRGPPKPTTAHFAPQLESSDWRLDGVSMNPGTGPERLPGGPETFDAYGKPWGNLSNTPLSGFKSEAYEGGIRTPLVVRWPNVIRSDGAIERSVGHVIDIFPTLLDAAGAEYPEEFQERRLAPLEGRSLVPVLQGRDSLGDRDLCWDAFGQAIRRGDWKLVRAAEEAPWELYDLENDGTETLNRASQFPERVAELQEAFRNWRTRVRVNP